MSEGRRTRDNHEQQAITYPILILGAHERRKVGPEHEANELLSEMMVRRIRWISNHPVGSRKMMAVGRKLCSLSVTI